jgi:Kef-type K+ transport system membrane component KefB
MFCIGWVLLALCVALVNAGTGLTALYVLLTCLGFILFLVYLVRPAFIWILRRNRALQDGPSQGMIALTLLLCLGCAFFTGIIGVHAIFGAFMAGLICPHEGGFAIKVAEKIEDLVGALFLPLYFTLSGLNTNIGLLDSGIVWAYVVGVIAVAFFSKFVSASIAARWTGMLWRECFAIGSLMSCKGLVELIVLVSHDLTSSLKHKRLTVTEHRTQCEDSQHSNVHDFRRHGAGHYLPLFAFDHVLLPQVVPEEGRVV